MVNALPHFAGFSYLFGKHYLKMSHKLKISVFCFIHYRNDSFESKETCSIIGPAHCILTPPKSKEYRPLM